MRPMSPSRYAACSSEYAADSLFSAALSSGEIVPPPAPGVPLGDVGGLVGDAVPLGGVVVGGGLLFAFAPPPEPKSVLREPASVDSKATRSPKATSTYWRVGNGSPCP